MNNEPAKKPIFKRAWFWIIIVILIVGVGVAASSKNDEPQKVDDGSESSKQTSSTENKEFSVGDVISIYGQEISVVSVERNYTTGNDFTEAPVGKEYVKVNLQIQNKSDETKSFNALDWEIESSDGVIDNYMNAALAQADDSLGSGDLATNGTKKGSIVFEVLANDPKLKIHFKHNFWTNKEILINL